MSDQDEVNPIDAQYMAAWEEVIQLAKEAAAKERDFEKAKAELDEAIGRAAGKQGKF